MPPIEGERAHESSEIAAKSIVLSALGLVVLAVAVHFSPGWVMGRFAGQESRIVASRPPLFAAAVDYAGPHLQGDPAAVGFAASSSSSSSSAVMAGSTAKRKLPTSQSIGPWTYSGNQVTRNF